MESPKKKTDSPWKQGDELLFSVRNKRAYNTKTYHYECYRDGMLECNTDLLFEEEVEKQHILDSLDHK